MITTANPIVGEEEIEAVESVLRSGMLAQGPKVAEFEARFADYCGTKYAVAVNSGTAAIHAALHAAGVGTDDEVITVPFSFIATVNPIILLGAKPVFVDVDPDTFTIDTNGIEAAITQKTKAILPVHLYGQPANMDEINDLAEQHGLTVIEDAAQAVGAEYKGRKTGSLGDMGCFSLYATKNIMCGEGGIVTTDSQEVVKKIKQFRQHGMSDQYKYVDIGYNYRMTDIHAAIALEQLKKVDFFNESRKSNAEFMRTRLDGVTGLKLPTAADDRTHVYHQFTISLSESIDREFVQAKLREKGVIAGVYYPEPLHRIPHVARYGYKKDSFPNSTRAAESVLSLPVHPKLESKELELVAKELIACLKA